MLSEIFYWVLNISVLGSVVGLVVLLLRKCRKLPRFAVYMLWAIPLLRFWVPFGMANQYSLLNFVSKYTTKTVVIWESVPDVTMTNSIMGAKSYFPIEYKTDLLENVFTVASAVWVIISVAAILTSCMLYFFTTAELKSAIFIKDNIYKSDKISTPAVYGVISPKIIIPAAIADGDIHYIITHEQVHIKRKDNLFRVVAVITACVHWFNPLLWIFLKYFFTDMELACDTKVLRQISDHKKKEYATALLSCAAGKTFFASAFGGVKIRVRIENILSYKKLTALSSLFFAALIVAIASILITNATA